MAGYWPHESLLDTSQFIATLENCQGLKVACPEEIAYPQGWIGSAKMTQLAQPLTKNGYGHYLFSVLSDVFMRERVGAFLNNYLLFFARIC